MSPKSLNEFLLLPARVLLALGTVAILLLFLPPNILDSFGLTDLIEEYRGHIAIAGLLSIAVGLSNSLFGNHGLIAFCLRKIKFYTTIYKAKRTLLSLSGQEKQILLYSVHKNSSTFYAEPHSASAKALVGKGIAKLNASGYSLPKMIASYTINPSVYRKANKLFAAEVAVLRSDGDFQHWVTKQDRWIDQQLEPIGMPLY